MTVGFLYKKQTYSGTSAHLDKKNMESGISECALCTQIQFTEHNYIANQPFIFIMENVLFFHSKLPSTSTFVIRSLLRFEVKLQRLQSRVQLSVHHDSLFA